MRTVHTLKLRKLHSAITLLAIGSILLLGSAQFGHADPGVSSTDISSQHVGDTATATVNHVPLAGAPAYANADPVTTAGPTSVPIPAKPAMQFDQTIGADALSQAREHLLLTLRQRLQTASLDELLVTVAPTEKVGDMITGAIEERLKTAETPKLVNVFVTTASQRIRLIIANTIGNRGDLDGQMILTMGSCQADDKICYETNLILAGLAAKTFANTDPQIMADLIGGQPFLIRQVVIESTLKKAPSVTTSTLVSMAVNLGQQIANHSALLNTITARSDCSAGALASMLAALDSGKG